MIYIVKKVIIGDEDRLMIKMNHCFNVVKSITWYCWLPIRVYL